MKKSIPLFLMLLFIGYNVQADQYEKDRLAILTEIDELPMHAEVKDIAVRLKQLESQCRDLKIEIDALKKDKEAVSCLAIKEYNRKYGGYISESKPPDDQYLIVVGDFEQKREAKLLAFRLREGRLSVWVTAHNVSGQDRFIVYAGTYSKYEEAARQGAILKKHGLIETYSVSAGAI